MGSRQPVSTLFANEVFIASRRRFCLCVFLEGKDERCKGQIAHLNRDPSDSRLENLVFLCLEHHDEYDSRTSQSKGFSVQEVRHYRDQLHERNRRLIDDIVPANTIPIVDPQSIPNREPTLPSEESYYDLVRKNFAEELEFTSKPWRYSFWQVADQPDLFAYKVNGGADGVCLIERINLPDGRIVIACIETGGNPGTSITNAVEDICFQVCASFEIPADQLVWLEHYDGNEYSDWSLVTFAQRPPLNLFQDPKWIDITPEIWRSLMLRPKKKLKSWHGRYESKLTKLFDWPITAILS